ncbi:MAG: hypothetical protein HC894_06320 [Microcoleus sp. SM1_3_4]|nr:hypothetical protein [Microcoleus sp. SM1_3_4]
MTQAVLDSGTVRNRVFCENPWLQPTGSVKNPVSLGRVRQPRQVQKVSYNSYLWEIAARKHEEITDIDRYY